MCRSAVPRAVERGSIEVEELVLKITPTSGKQLALAVTADGATYYILLIYHMVYARCSCADCADYAYLTARDRGLTYVLSMMLRMD
eukprot:3331153-Pyramimonas_sp.AAC.2